MKRIFACMAILGISLSACNDGNNISNTGNKAADTSANPAAANNTSDQQPASVDEVVTAYLQLKNALTNDDGKEAANAGKQLQNALQKLDNASFTAEQKKVYDEVKEDVNEHAEHIATKGDDIAHQREHFDMVSLGMYDFVKSVKPKQTLYRTHCPMYNDKKGAYWLSETKDIKNPYYGKKMLTCGTVKEEIK